MVLIHEQERFAANLALLGPIVLLKDPERSVREYGICHLERQRQNESGSTIVNEDPQP